MANKPSEIEESRLTSIYNELGGQSGIFFSFKKKKKRKEKNYFLKSEFKKKE